MSPWYANTAASIVATVPKKLMMKERMAIRSLSDIWDTVGILESACEEQYVGKLLTHK